VFRVHQSNAPSVNIETAVELYTLGFTFDVKDLLPKITAPTLVMHRESTRAIPFRLGRELAASIRGARFVPLEGQAHNSWEEYPDAAIAAIGEFLGVPLALASVEEPPERFLAVMVVELEPAAGASVEDEVRRAIAMHNGTEITQNDGGVKALFAAAADAVECAIDVERMLAAQVPERAVRIGVHAGEQVARGGAPADTVVAVARQAAAACATSEIMVSAAIRERCAGHGFLFAERDASAVLEGERLAWYEVQWRQDA
jgi:hypothetical protein